MDGMSWIVWLSAMAAGTLSARVSTVMLRGGVEQQGVRSVFQALSFLAILVLAAVPFFALEWYFAILVALGATFVNPAMFFVSRQNAGGIYGILLFLNIATIASAAYFATRMFARISLGYGAL
jgi:hypothetical protein